MKKKILAALTAGILTTGGEAGSDNNLGKLHFLQGGRVSGYDKPEPLCLWMRGRLDVPEDKRH